MSNHPHRKQHTIRLDHDSYRLHEGIVQFFEMTPQSADRDGGLPNYRCTWVNSGRYRVGTQAVLVSVTDVSPNSIRAGRNEPKYSLSFDLDGVPGNMDHKIKRVSGWRGTTNDRSVDAHGVVTIRKIRQLRNGDVAVTVR